ncbi:tetratricopeptide repeat protein [Kallotenue papyrolyticum]|uniref:tetratricopeptide repeat protein n=1 Tax=Kallotenue papyrolyticum TaxID=1325125 RepID=UPI0004785F67|nr:tetratricopeptide repeat protein [Kallotenue papyrolyticum]
MNASLWPTSRRRRLALIVIVAVGLALRLGLWLHTPIHQPANDETEYLPVARDLLAGRGWVFYERYHWLRAPLYPLWLAASLWLAGGDLRWAALPNIALSALTIPLLYLLGRQLGPADARRAEQVGLLAAAAGALLLTLATFASLWMSETLFTALFLLTLLALLRYDRQPQTRWALAAGVLFGLATLTRSLPLLTLPLVVLWLVWGRHRERRVLRHAAGFALAAALTIAPWTLRNALAYGAFIPVETGLSFNLWMFNEPREDWDTIFRTLEAIPNPAARADYATAKGLARLREDPAILLRKLDPNWTYLWMIKPIEDRFLLPTYYADVGFGRFLLALILDDALYLAIAVLGIAGLWAAPADRRKALLGGWVAYALGVILLTHGEMRYRHFFFPVLIPYAAWLLVGLRASPPLRRALRIWLGLALALALLARPVLGFYEYRWAWRNLSRGWAVLQAELAERRGDDLAAIANYHTAIRRAPGTVDARIALARLLLRRGMTASAVATLEQARAQTPSYARLNVWRGEAYRRSGQLTAAREAFKGYYNYETELLQIAWDELQESPPPATLDVGGGLDFGFVHGLYAAEQLAGRSMRWSGARAELRLAGTTQGGVVSLTLAAPRPDGLAVPLRICAAEQCVHLTIDAVWRTVRLLAPPGSETRVTLTVPTFRPRDLQPDSPDDRQLGVAIDGALVRPRAAP